MHSTTGEVIRRKARRLVTSPLVLWSTLQGGLLAYWCNNGVWNNWDNVAVSLLALGLGTAAYRLTIGGKKHTARAREDLRRIGKKREGAKLRQMKRGMSRMQDPRLLQSLNSLDAAFERLQQVDRWRCESTGKKSLEIAEIHDQACRLYLECRNMLERTQELFQGASQMATEEVRSRVMKSREELFGELKTSLHHLDHALDEVYSAQLSGKAQPIAEAAELRDELSRQVDVARQVEERMDELTNDWRQTPPLSDDVSSE